MRREEAVKEWCIEKAIVIRLNTKGTVGSTKDIVETAKELEKYITDYEPVINTE